MGIKKRGGVSTSSFLLPSTTNKLLNSPDSDFKYFSQITLFSLSSIAQSYFRSQELSPPQPSTPHPPTSVRASCFSPPWLAPLNSSQPFPFIPFLLIFLSSLDSMLPSVPSVCRSTYRSVPHPSCKNLLGRGRPSALLAQPVIHGSSPGSFAVTLSFYNFTPLYILHLPPLLPFLFSLPVYFYFLEIFFSVKLFATYPGRRRYLRTYCSTLTQHWLVITWLCL